MCLDIWLDKYLAHWDSKPFRWIIKNIVIWWWIDASLMKVEVTLIWFGFGMRINDVSKLNFPRKPSFHINTSQIWIRNNNKLVKKTRNKIEYQKLCIEMWWWFVHTVTCSASMVDCKILELPCLSCFIASYSSMKKCYACSRPKLLNNSSQTIT